MPLAADCEPLGNPDFRRFMFAMGAWTVTLALPGYSNGTPGFLMSSICTTPLEPAIHKLRGSFSPRRRGAVVWGNSVGHRIDRLGARAVAMLLCAIGPLFTLVWFLASPTRMQLPFLGEVPRPVLLMSVASLVIGGMSAGCSFASGGSRRPTSANRRADSRHGGPFSFAGIIGALGALAGADGSRTTSRRDGAPGSCLAAQRSPTSTSSSSAGLPRLGRGFATALDGPRTPARSPKPEVPVLRLGAGKRAPGLLPAPPRCGGRRRGLRWPGELRRLLPSCSSVIVGNCFGT